MTDSEKLDLLLEKVIGLEKDMIDVKADLRRLHRDDILILEYEKDSNQPSSSTYLHFW